MRFEVRVITRAKTRKLEMAMDGTLVARVPEPAHGGRANRTLIALLAEHFHVPRRAVSIVQGLRSRHKLVEIAREAREPSSS